MPGDRNRVGANATAFEGSEAAGRSLDEIIGRIAALERGDNRGPGSSFCLPFTFVTRAGSRWVIDEVAGSLKVTGPSATVTTIAPP